MNHPPAIALLEFDSIAVGVRTADAMAKKAPLNLFRVGTVQPGKYLVLIGGAVAAVDESHREGLLVGGESITDAMLLPDVHKKVYAAMEGLRVDDTADALGVLETSAIPTNIAAADKAVKTADVVIVEIRLGDGLGGKGITLMTGLLHDVQAAMQAAVAVASKPGVTVHQSIVPIQHRDLRGRVRSSTRFYPRDGAPNVVTVAPPVDDERSPVSRRKRAGGRRRGR